MYLKCYYKLTKAGKRDHEVTIEEIEKAIMPLANEIHNLMVDDDIQTVCVQFPEHSTYADWQRVQQHLRSQGFEIE